MRIEEVEVFVQEVKDLISEAHSQGITDGHSMARVRKPGEIRDYVGFDGFIARWTEALRTEAWYPIERAEEMGAKDGRWLVLYDGGDPFPGWYHGQFWDGKWSAITGSFPKNPTHFRFINPPEGS